MGPGKSQENTKERPDESRRDFLKMGIAVFGSTLLNGNIPDETVPKIPDGKRWVDYELDEKEAKIGPEIEHSLNELKEGLEQKYNFTIELDDTEIEASSSAASRGFTELRLIKKYEALLVLEFALAKYPTFTISKSGLKNLLVTTKSDSKEIGFVTLKNLDAPERKDQPELVVAYDWNSGEDIPEESRLSPKRRNDKSYEELSNTTRLIFENTIHHEVFHFLIDVPGTENSPRYEEDAFIDKWSEAYGDFNKNKSEEYAKILSEQSENEDDTQLLEVPGFAVPYGLKSDREDRASVAEFLLSGFEAYLVKDSDNHVLHQKVDTIKEFYFNLSNGLMDDEYWFDLSIADKFAPTTSEFSAKAWHIIDTPHDKYIYNNRVSKQKYTEWQNRLKIEYPNRLE